MLNATLNNSIQVHNAHLALPDAARELRRTWHVKQQRKTLIQKFQAAARNAIVTASAQKDTKPSFTTIHRNGLHMSKSFRIATLVKTVIIENIPVVDGNDIQLRVEVFAWSDHEYTCQVFRLDTYRIRPSFVKMMADEELLVIDGGVVWDDLRATTPDGLLNLLFEKMEWQFGVKIDRP